MHTPRPIYNVLLLVSIGFGVIFAVLMILIITTYSGTSWYEEIWWLTYDNSPPLIGSLVFVVLLIFWWSVAIAVSALADPAPTQASEKLVIAASQVLCIAIGSVLWVAWDSVELENYHRYGNITRTESLLEHMIGQDPNLVGFRVEGDKLALQHLFGVWELEEKSGFLPEGTRYIAFWRSGDFQWLNRNYQQLERGRARISIWGEQEGRADWLQSSLKLYGESGRYYYGRATQKLEVGKPFALEFSARLLVGEGYTEYDEPEIPVRVVLRNQKRIHSSHPIELSRGFEFYDESDRSRSWGNRVNEEALYP